MKKGLRRLRPYDHDLLIRYLQIMSLINIALRVAAQYDNASKKFGGKWGKECLSMRDTT